MNKPKNKLTFEMTERKDLDKLLKKINNRANIDIQDKEGDTALTLASCYDKIEYVKLLIENGADINIQNNDGNTALMSASYNGNIDVCKLLIENGADIDIQNKYGETALIYASLSEQIEICKYLINNGADVNIKDEYEDTAVDTMKTYEIYRQVAPYKILGLKYFKEVFKEHSESYMDIFNTTLYSQDLELGEIKANIERFYSTIVSRMDNNAINEDLEL